MQGGTLQGNGIPTTMLSSDYQIVDAVDVFNNGHADLIVQQQSTGQVEITSQNHNYAVRPGPGSEVTHVNLNDGVVEGIRSPAANVFPVA